LLSITAGVFQARHSHVWARRCYGSKINKDKLIKVPIVLAGPMRQGDMIRCLLMSQRSGRIHNEIQKSSRRQQGYTHPIQDSKAYTSSRDQQKQVMMKLSRICSSGNRQGFKSRGVEVGYWDDKQNTSSKEQFP
jgi:hypothetical protein